MLVGRGVSGMGVEAPGPDRFVAFMASKKYIDPTLTLVPYQIEALRCARHYVFLVFG